MDAFSLKKDNRKKFQDKQKLKRKHATPSDRKYRLLNRQKEETATEEQEQEQEQPELDTNEDRYHEDPELAFEDPNTAATSVEVNRVLKDVLRSRQLQDYGNTDTNQAASADALKTKDLKQMGAAELNRWLHQQNTTTTKTTAAVGATSPSVQSEQPAARQQGATPPADLPEELETDQDFLDGLL
ncbi:hypothetical protein SEUBUCD646_0E01170 [Saccharomyces eubayanus]|uniref:YER034W n=2 Tax=Saccharomyces TaxID=4930 RepID=A0A6C1E6K0_SACPS|nr:hypothetical protein GRS66_007082 [Saccharomyces pastorianus]CAI1950418.1 hypothetical protein SEUBUCD650_0E01210 [Saccharomyces eubayanus]CAI1978859.1 hypothetical protein SEUBUCD646_0E01170 [Saccharomyces eubayanus]